jgi:putative DNA primase/helicase
MKLKLMTEQIGPEPAVVPHLDTMKMPATYEGPPKFKGTTKNVKTILQRDSRWSNRIWKNEFTDLTMVEAHESSDVQEVTSWKQQHLLDVIDFVQVNYEIDPTTKMVELAVDIVGSRKGVSRHPLREYLRQCMADYPVSEYSGLINTWMFDYLGVSTDMNGVDAEDLLSTVGRKWLIGAVARAFRAGCKMDNVLILKGTQGTGKSTALEFLASKEYFHDSQIDLKSKDAYQALTGCWIVEFAELDSMKRSQATAIKAFLSSSKDRFRPSYGSKVVEVHRHTVFCGTTNDQEFLIDTTGNRRFWPVETNEIDCLGLKKIRDRLWSEACHAFFGGETWHLPPELEVEYEQRRSEYVQSHPWEGLVKSYCARQTGPVSVNDVLEKAIEIEKGRWNRAHQQIVSTMLKDMGWKAARKQGKRVWMPPYWEDGQ